MIAVTRKTTNQFYLAFIAMVPMAAHSAVVTIPNSSLFPTTTLYTDDIGGGIGSALVMTGGGNAANVGSSPNDDGFSGPISLGFSLNFFGTTYSTFFANNNGNISFGSGISAFTPTGPQGASQPIISPYFADVDTRNAASGVMSLRTDIADQIIVTWPGVGFFNGHGTPLDTFQLVLRSTDYAVPAGEGQIGFFWTTMGWETGDASGGSNGFGGTPAAVGFGDGQSNGFVLEGSTVAGISGIVQNHKLWVNLDDQGIPEVPVPAAGWLAGTALAVLGMRAKRRRSA